MDARKASFREKLRKQQKSVDKRINSPLVRYNEYDQPICRVCNITLKSESLWAGHQASRKHHEAIDALKAAAPGKGCANAAISDRSEESNKSQRSSMIPADFFDKHESKRQKNDEVKEPCSLPSTETKGHSSSLLFDGVKKRTDAYASQFSQLESNKQYAASHKKEMKALPKGFFEEGLTQDTSHNQHDEVSRPMAPKSKDSKGTLPEGFFDAKGNEEPMNQLGQSLKGRNSLELKQVKGTLPEGFFDNKDSDLRARGIQPVKVDINDVYKEFEKDIQDDLQDVDDRLEEEEIDAAEMREEFESLEQQQYREQVEMVKKRLIEVRAARHAKVQPVTFMGQESSDESSSDSDNAEEDFTVDWRAKHL